MAGPCYELTLFVTGLTPRSMHAISNLKKFCETELAGACELEIVDLYANPERAEPANVVVSPTLIRHKPKPVKLLIGDMSDRTRLLSVIKAE